MADNVSFCVVVVRNQYGKHSPNSVYTVGVLAVLHYAEELGRRGVRVYDRARSYWYLPYLGTQRFAPLQPFGRSQPQVCMFTLEK